MAPINEI